VKLTYKVLLFVSIVSFLAFAFLFLTGHEAITGPFLIAALVSLAIAVRGFSKFKGFSYSLLILTAVTVSMYYPKYFLGVGDFQFKLLIVPLLQIIMFGMGSQMSLKDFAGVVKMPKGVIVGVICQFTIMPIMGITVARMFNFPPEIAAGIILVGSSPSGMASNVMSFIANGWVFSKWNGIQRYVVYSQSKFGFVGHANGFCNFIVATGNAFVNESFCRRTHRN